MLGVFAGRDDSIMLGQSMEDHSSGLRDSVRVDLQFFHLAATCLDGAPRNQSTRSDQETSLLALPGGTGGGSYQSDSHFLRSALSKASRMWLDFML